MATTPNDLTSLKARALKAFASKDFSSAVDLYSQACALQAELHKSEDDPRNAHLLYQYGRALFELARSKSDILGGAPDEKPPATTSTSTEPTASASAKPAVEPKTGAVLHFEGDENWDDASSDEEEEGEAEAEEDDDEMGQAWTILDLARVLYEKQLPDLEPESAAHRNLITILSDVYDLLGEVSLESEGFPQAAKDLEESLKHKLSLYPTTHSYIAEAHFKLALALEFSAAGEEVSEEDGEKLRQRAASELEKAIDSCKGRLAAEEEKLAAKVEGESRNKEEKEVKDVKEMIAELEQRMNELREPVKKDEEEGGLLGELLGGDPAEAKKRLQEMLGGAKDVSGLVRKKEKRKAEDEGEAEGKKVKVEEDKSLEKVEEESEE